MTTSLGVQFIQFIQFQWTFTSLEVFYIILSNGIPEITGFQLAYPMIYHGYSNKQNIYNKNYIWLVVDLPL